MHWSCCDFVCLRLRRHREGRQDAFAAPVLINSVGWQCFYPLRVLFFPITRYCTCKVAAIKRICHCWLPCKRNKWWHLMSFQDSRKVDYTHLLSPSILASMDIHALIHFPAGCPSSIFCPACLTVCLQTYSKRSCFFPLPLHHPGGTLTVNGCK